MHYKDKKLDENCLVVEDNFTMSLELTANVHEHG